MKLILTFLRIAAGLIVLTIAAFHFYNFEVMAVYVPLPKGAKLFVLFIALSITACSLGIIMNKYLRQSFFALAIIFAVTGLMILIPTIHFSNDQLLQLIQIPNLYKVVLAVIILISLLVIPPQNKNIKK